MLTVQPMFEYKKYILNSFTVVEIFFEAEAPFLLSTPVSVVFFTSDAEPDKPDKAKGLKLNVFPRLENFVFCSPRWRSADEKRNLNSDGKSRREKKIRKLERCFDGAFVKVRINIGCVFNLSKRPMIKRYWPWY